MKKVLLFTALIFSTAFLSNAQDNRDEFKFGVKAGATLSNVWDTKGEDFNADPRVGYTAGLNLEIPLGQIFGIHPEVLITQKGFKGSGSLLGSNYSYKRTTTYLEIPLLLALKPNQVISIVAGPQFAYLLMERNQFESSLGSFAQEEEFKQDNIRKNMLGFVGGFDLNFDHISVGARVGTDFQSNRGDGTSDTPRYKNVWGQLTLGYRFF
ncbi:MAG TPA: porin family protein [Brumimicrobium sp.]|nr:porin family protein [Brumimicrobium sp.]